MEKIVKKILKNKKIIIGLALLLIILLGDRLRTFSYSSVPHPGETADEYAYGWLGLSLIKDKYPMSWTLLDNYSNKATKKINVDMLYDVNPNIPPFSIAGPWFDNPPLFGFITGGYAYLKGARSFTDASVILLRRPMLKIALLTTVLIFILATQLFGVKVGLLSALLYSVIPSVVISSRLAIIENGFIPLYLGSLIFANLYFKKKKIKYWIWANIFASIAVLFKLSALSIELSLILIAFCYGEKNKKKLLLTCLLGSILPLIIFCLYGAYYDWKTFVNVFWDNSKRFYGASSEIFYTAVVLPKIAKFFTDGWITVGWISTIVISLIGWKKEKAPTLLTIYVFSYLIVFLILGSQSYGWYRFPFYPFLIISIAKVFVSLIEFPNIFAFLALALLPFGTTIHKLIGVDGFQKYVPFFRLSILISLLVFVLPIIIKNKLAFKIQQIFMIIILFLLCFWSIKEIFFYTYGSWFSAT